MPTASNTNNPSAFQERLRRKISNSSFRCDHLPCGMYTTVSGREILFNRYYKPLGERSDGGKPQIANRNEWVPDIIKEKTVHFYKDRTPDKASPGLEALRDWGIDLTGCKTVKALKIAIGDFVWPQFKDDFGLSWRAYCAVSGYRPH